MSHSPSSAATTATPAACAHSDSAHSRTQQTLARTALHSLGVTLLVTVATGLTIASAHAQNSPPPSQGGPCHAHGSREAKPGERNGQHHGPSASSLGLIGDQATRFEALMAAEREQHQRIREQTRTQLKTLLSAEQLAQLDPHRPPRPEGMPPGAGKDQGARRR